MKPVEKKRGPIQKKVKKDVGEVLQDGNLNNCKHGSDTKEELENSCINEDKLDSDCGSFGEQNFS